MLIIFLEPSLVVNFLKISIGFCFARRSGKPPRTMLWGSLLIISAAYFVGLGLGQVVEHFTHHAAHASAVSEHSPNHGVAHHESASTAISSAEQRKLTGVFFSIYYAMTGVHAVHIVVGMGVIAWLLVRSLRGDFSPAYYGPVDYVGLYWHLVDLVWIYLFPLLYLIR